MASVYRLLQECGSAQILRLLFFFPEQKATHHQWGLPLLSSLGSGLTNRPPTDSNCSLQVRAYALHAADITADPESSPHHTPHIPPRPETQHLDISHPFTPQGAHGGRHIAFSDLQIWGETAKMACSLPKRPTVVKGWPFGVQF